jgi:hypothetical protein
VKRLFGIFVLTPAEQRVVIFVVLLLVAFALLKHHRDLRYESATPVTSSASPASND